MKMTCNVPGPAEGSTRKLLIRPDEAAELLSCSRSQIYHLLAAGLLPGVRLGKALRIPLAALEALAAGEPTVTEACR